MRKRVVALLAVVGLAVVAVVFALPSGASPVSGSITTSLSGKDEVPKGDAKATGTATITFDVAKRTVCWKFRLTGVAAPTAAHIHEAPPGKAGAVVVPFGKAYKPSGCVAAKPAQIRELLDEPTEYYVNVHNAKYPAGVVRGQL
jgi:hypothetical protein